MTQEPNDFVAEAKEQVATYTCEGSHHNHDLIVGLLTKIEHLKEGWETAFGIGVSEQEQNKKLRTEIERLRLEYETAFNVGYEEAKEGCVAEVERLRGHKEEADRHIATIAELRAEVERLRVQIIDDCTSHNKMLENWSIERQELRVEIEQLRTEKTEMADAILQIGGLSEAHFRTLVSFEVAEFVFTERTAAMGV